MAVWWAVVPGFLEQEIGNSRSPRCMFFLYRHLHDYPVHAGWLGCTCGWVPCYDRESCVSYEGSRSVRGVVLSVKARRRESGAVEGSLCRISETTLPDDESRQGLERTSMNVRNDNIPNSGTIERSQSMKKYRIILPVVAVVLLVAWYAF